MKPRPPILAVFGVFAVLALWSSTCPALFITGIGKLMEGPANGRRIGTFDLLAYSEFGNVKNETSNDSFNNRFPAQVVAGETITLNGPPAGVPRKGFTPVVGLTGGAKQNVQGFATVVSCPRIATDIRIAISPPFWSIVSRSVWHPPSELKSTILATPPRPNARTRSLTAGPCLDTTAIGNTPGCFESRNATPGT